MGSIDNIKPLSAAQSSNVNKSKQHQEKNSWECQELNPGLLCNMQVCYLCATQPTSPYPFYVYQACFVIDIIARIPFPTIHIICKVVPSSGTWFRKLYIAMMEGHPAGFEPANFKLVGCRSIRSANLNERFMQRFQLRQRWWSSGQRPCLQLWRSEFESCWLLK